MSIRLFSLLLFINDMYASKIYYACLEGEGKKVLACEMQLVAFRDAMHACTHFFVIYIVKSVTLASV